MTRACCGSRWDGPGPSTATAPTAPWTASIELPTTNPTSVAFGDIDGADLYITTSWLDLDADSRAAQPLAGAIFRCRPGVTGPPSPRYAGIPAAPEPSPERDLDARRAEKGDIS